MQFTLVKPELKIIRSKISANTNVCSTKETHSTLLSFSYFYFSCFLSPYSFSAFQFVFFISLSPSFCYFLLCFLTYAKSIMVTVAPPSSATKSFILLGKCVCVCVCVCKAGGVCARGRCCICIRVTVFNKYSSIQELFRYTVSFNPLKPELNPICYLLALLGAHHFLHVSRIRVKLLTLR